MQNEMEKLRQRNRELEAENKALRSENESLHTRIALLEEETELLNRKLQHVLRQLFGRKSEVVDLRQMELALSGVEAAVSLPAIEPEAAMKHEVAGKQRRKRVRKPRLPENLPTEDIIIEPEEVRAQPQDYRQIGEEITEELDVIPPKYFRRRFIRRKYVNRTNRALPPVVAELPPRLIEGGYAGIGLVTDIAVKKYFEHLPLYRQEQTLKRCYGIELSRKTMCDWLNRAAWWLKPVYQHIAGDLKNGDYLQIDETPVRYCRAEGGGSRQGYLWVYHRPGAGVLYEWHTGRGAECLDGMLKTFEGTIQTDGYAAYDCYAKKRSKQIEFGENKQAIVTAGCWAHARRKFYEAMDESPVLAGWFIRQIQHLYHIENELRRCKAGPKLRECVRSAQSMMVLPRIEKTLRMKLAAHRPTSMMGKAIAYALSQWKDLMVYVKDGRVEIDNNLVENAIRPTAVGKKNYLFFGDPEAGEHSAIFYTLLENCKREGINPYEYLHDVLTRRLSMPLSQIGQLTPAAWAAARKESAA